MDMDRLRELREKWSEWLDEVFDKKDDIQALQINQEQLDELGEFHSPLYEYTDLRTGSKIQTLYNLPVQIRDVVEPVIVMKSNYKPPIHNAVATDQENRGSDDYDEL